MKDSPRKTERAPATQPRAERSRLGLIAGYLHSLSDRHTPTRTKDERARAA